MQTYTVYSIHYYLAPIQIVKSKLCQRDLLYVNEMLIFLEVSISIIHIIY